MDELGLLNTSPGGDELNRKLIENLTRKQATLGNLAPGQRFSLANRGKSIKAIFDAADDDDDEDFFKEFDVEDLDIEAPEKPLRTVTSGISEDMHQAAADVETAQADGGLPKENPATPENPHMEVEQSAVEQSAAAAETGPLAKSEAALPGPRSETAQEAAHADTDTIMQEADIEAKKPAQGAADTEMADLGSMITPIDAHQAAPALDQATQNTLGNLPPAEAATTDPAFLLQQQADEPQANLGIDSTGEPPAKAPPANILGGPSLTRQTAQVRSASAGSIPSGSTGASSAMLAEQKAGLMHSPAAGILSKASPGGSTAAAAVQPETGPVQHATTGVPNKTTAVQSQLSQLPSAAAHPSSKAPTTAVYTTDGPATLPGVSSHQQQEVQMPSLGATGHTQQSQKAADMPEVPVATAAGSMTAAHAVPAAWGGQPGQSGLPQLGNSAITPPLRAGLFSSPIAANPGKAPARVLPMPRTSLPRLPQIIRLNAPARPQLPGKAVPAAAKPPVPSPNPNLTASMDGLVTPVPNTRAGTQAGGSLAHSRSQPSQSLQDPIKTTANAHAEPAALPTPVSGAPSTLQTPADAFQGTPGTLGNAIKVVGTTPVTVSEGLQPAAAASHGQVKGNLGAAFNLGSPDQPGVAEPPQAKELCTQPALNLDLLRGQHQLERLVMEAQKMADQALELKVMAAIVGNRVTRLNSPMLAAKLRELKQRAEQLLKPED